MCIYVWGYMHVCVCIYVYACVYMWVYASHICVCEYVWMYLVLSMCVCLYVCIYIYVCLWVYMCVYMYVCWCMYMCMYVSVWVYVCEHTLTNNQQVQTNSSQTTATLTNRKEGNVLFNDVLNTFYLWLYGARYMVKDCFICTIPQTGQQTPQPERDTPQRVQHEGSIQRSITP